MTYALVHKEWCHNVMHCEGILSIIQSKEDSNYLALELVK